MGKYEIGGKCRRGHVLTEENLRQRGAFQYCFTCEQIERKRRHKARMKSDPEYREKRTLANREKNRRHRERKTIEVERIAEMVLTGELDIENESVTDRSKRIVEARRAGNELTWGSEVDLTSTLVRPSAKKQWDALNEAKQNLIHANMDWNCKDRWEEFALYSDENAPTAEQAEEMCSGCPLLQLCDTYATAQRETDGVWGGKQRRKIMEASE